VDLACLCPDERRHDRRVGSAIPSALRSVGDRAPAVALAFLVAADRRQRVPAQQPWQSHEAPQVTIGVPPEGHEAVQRSAPHSTEGETQALAELQLSSHVPSIEH
jgi:hypothetical protein